MSRHALEVLEFARVLEHIAGRASSELAKGRIRALSPSSDPSWIREELGRVGAMMEFCDEKPEWGMPVVPDARLAVRDLAAPGAVLEPIHLYRVGVLLRSSRLLRMEMDARERRHPPLASLEERLVVDGQTEQMLLRSVDEEGQVLDTASGELRRIRSRIKGAHLTVVRRLEAHLRTLSERFVVPDASVSIRDGRYVIPIRREGRREVGGIVHDESHTGATLFVEPPLAIELMNRLRDLEREEAREIRRILGELSDRLAPVQAELRGTLDALVELDDLHARARSALAWRADVPEVLDPDTRELEVIQGRHPLLLEAEDAPVIPFDLEIATGERALVVSGPNTGGKSVFLKAVGLIAALTQSGIVPPVSRGTRLPVFSSFFADIGDEQSIAHNLSTFSAHLANLSDLVREADGRSLVLIDEMGTGTDPAEGAALATAVLEELVMRGAFAVVSSHLGQLKSLAGDGTGIVNGSLQFDPDRMEPTYHFVKGRPGRSYGLAIARRRGFPARVLDRAERHREGGEARLESVLEELERREVELEDRLMDAASQRSRAARLTDEVEKREQAVREAERTADRRAREDARRLLLEARNEVEEAIATLREEIQAGAAMEEAAKKARRRVEGAIERTGGEAGRGDRREREGRALPTWSPGQRVRVRETGAKGVVAEVREGRATVEIGALRLELPVDDLEPVDAEVSPEIRSRGRVSWTGTVATPVRTEIDLRGLRVDEAASEVIRALDQAVLEDLSELRIIHGKGTGALRQRVGEVLAGDPRVVEHRMGGPTEGGAGVTVAKLS
ncbi:MAG: Smr/MutS family protein [Gemmatimonadota bacterium]